MATFPSHACHPQPQMPVLQALEASGVGLGKEELEGLDRAKCGILIGTAMGGMQTFSTAVEDLTLKVHTCTLRPDLCREAQPQPQKLIATGEQR